MSSVCHLLKLPVGVKNVIVDGATACISCMDIAYMKKKKKKNDKKFWAHSSEKVPLNMHKMCRFGSS